jgi:hypothetical protein
VVVVVGVVVVVVVVALTFALGDDAVDVAPHAATAKASTPIDVARRGPVFAPRARGIHVRITPCCGGSSSGEEP